MAEKVIVSEVIEYVRAALKYLRRLKPFRGQEELIWEAEQHLARLLERGGQEGAPPAVLGEAT